MKRKDAKLICNDIAKNMCIIAVRRLQELSSLIESRHVCGYRQQIGSISGLPNQDSDIRFEGDCYSVKSLNTDVVHADSECISSRFKEQQFCVVLSCMSLHCVSDPQKMLRETFKILKHGGKAAFNVWGRKEGSYQFECLEKTKEKFGIPPSTKRNSWHLNNKEALIQMLQHEGFVDVLAWESYIPYLKHNKDFRKEECRYLLLIDWPSNLHSKLEEAVEYFMQILDVIYEEMRSPAGLNALYVTGRKP